MIFALTIFFFSIVGIAALLLRHVPQVVRMSDEELVGILQNERPLLTQAWEYALGTVRTVWYRHFREQAYAFAVKKISHIRILFLRVEQVLFRFASRLRARTHSPKIPSVYWKDMHDWRKTVHWQNKDHLQNKFRGEISEIRDGAPVKILKEE